MFLNSNYLKFQNISKFLLNFQVPSLFKQVKFFSLSTSKDKNKKEIVFITPKIYADVNHSREKNYYDFESMTLTQG